MFRIIFGNYGNTLNKNELLIPLIIKRHAAVAGNASCLPKNTPNTQADQCAIEHNAVFRSISPAIEARLARVVAATGDGKVVL